MPRGHWTVSKIDMPNLKELVEDGWHISDLAQRYKCNPQVVWLRIRKAGIPYNTAGRRSGRHNGSWNGGRVRSGDYVYVKYPDHPHATQNGYVLESRLVMEKKLGRYLLPSEVVHHHKGYSNDPDNLFVYSSNGEHLKDTLKGKCPKWTEDGKRRILEGVRQPRVKRRKSIRVRLESNDS